MSSKKIAKTNAARLLERLEIPFTLHQADVDESDLSAVTMAHKLGAFHHLPHGIANALLIR